MTGWGIKKVNEGFNSSEGLLVPRWWLETPTSELVGV